MTTYMCPHCGREYSPRACRGQLIPNHTWGKMRAICPGSMQTPRNAQTDRRPLWSEQGETNDEPRPS